MKRTIKCPRCGQSEGVYRSQRFRSFDQQGLQLHCIACGHMWSSRADGARLIPMWSAGIPAPKPGEGE